eukprot:SAG22_NODE_1893_length_3367_cov_2.848531_5_plen_127_part_00
MPCLAAAPVREPGLLHPQPAMEDLLGEPALPSSGPAGGMDDSANAGADLLADAGPGGGDFGGGGDDDFFGAPGREGAGLGGTRTILFRVGRLCGRQLAGGTGGRWGGRLPVAPRLAQDTCLLSAAV